jgi:DNA-binding response OmpR family regulator
MKIKKILIVDDDLEYMNELEEFLLTEDFEVIKKNNTRRILFFIQNANPDLIILDFKINGMTGIDVTRIVKDCNTTKDIPIILVSNFHNSDSNNHKVIESGVQIYLKKTIKPELLLNEIRKIEQGH